MSAPFFFQRGQGLTVGEIASLTRGEPHAGAELDRRITGIAALDRATPSDLAFLDNLRHAADAAVTSAGACLVSERLAGHLPGRVSLLCVHAPYRAFVDVARALFPDSLRPSSLFDATGIAPGGTVHDTARLENGVTIDPGAVIGPRAEIGTGTVIGAGTVIGPGVRIGRHCSIGPNVSIVHALIGDRAIIHPGCSIGQDGFGFVMGAKGHAKVPQLARVIIQDDVEIGSNTTIDRGGLRDTVIGEGSKIDNLVQIGHNVTIGRHCIVISQCGLSGSVVLEDYVTLAGQVGIADHVVIGEGAVVGAKSGVNSNIPAGEKWLGYPAMPGREFHRSVIALRQSATRSSKTGNRRATGRPQERVIAEPRDDE
jgi:UDP-3-O-[3-hydroxymyristoyl] glucosamine N-acyltransferase